VGKKQIVFCDLTKQETEEDLLVTITIKLDGKKPRSYDLSPEAAAKLEQQLVGGSKLSEEWGFYAQALSPERSGRPRPARTVGDLDNGAERTIADKKAELREAGILPTQQEAESEVTEIIGGKKDCPHMNKGRIQTTLRDGKRFIFRLCTECRARIPEMSKASRDAYLDGKVSKTDDVNIREL
jgi:hypothetical protein